MRRRDISLIAAALGMSIAAFGADQIAWGPAVNDVRLGVSFGRSSPEPEVRVLLKNTGSRMLEILTGAEAGKGTTTNFKFIAVAPDGKERECFHVDNLTSMAGLVLPVAARLEPGAIHERRFPLNKIVCVENRSDITFDRLLKRGYSLRVSLEGDAKAAQSARLSQAWIGKVVSVDLAPPE
ncbi:MAG TPA: hypothetical protein VE999_18955 [Gemmataceae bacterium]|jgi:hypothetical protein|nr:hypothetical protein [Gemmataceae bacterium]